MFNKPYTINIPIYNVLLIILYQVIYGYYLDDLCSSENNINSDGIVFNINNHLKNYITLHNYK